MTLIRRWNLNQTALSPQRSRHGSFRCQHLWEEAAVAEEVEGAEEEEMVVAVVPLELKNYRWRNLDRCSRTAGWFAA
jgi:hypothetical protein